LFTVIVAVAVAVQVFTSVAFTVYTVKLVGLSVGFVIVFPLIPPPVQVYVLAPLIVTVPVCCPKHIVLLVDVNVGGLFTVTVAVVITVHVPAVPTIVYTFGPTVVGLAVTTPPVVALNPIAGLHAKLVALLVAVKLKVVCPLHIEPLLTEIVGVPIIVIVPVAVAVQVCASVPFTV
jgi:hypothetical protein